MEFGSGVMLVVTVGDMHRDANGHTDRTTITIGLGAAVKLKYGEVEANGGPFIKLDVYDYKYYVTQNFQNILFDMKSDGKPWSSVRDLLGLPASITQEQFAQAVSDAGSTGSFVFDIVRTAAKLSPGSQSGTVNLATDYANPGPFVAGWFPGLAGLTSVGASPGATASWTRRADGSLTFDRHYYQSTTVTGNATLSGMYKDNTGLTKEFQTVQVWEVARADANGNAILGPDKQPLITRIVAGNDPNNPNASVIGDPVAGTFMVTYFDAAQGKYITTGVKWDGHTADELLKFLLQNAADPNALFQAVNNGSDNGIFQVVHREVGPSATIVRTQTPGIVQLGGLIAPSSGESPPAVGDGTETVVTGRRIQRDVPPAQNCSHAVTRETPL